MGFIKSFRDAFGSETDDEFEINGAQVQCPHCGGVHFEQSKAQLNTAGLSFLDLDWANRSATILICKECSHIEWFLDDPDAI